MVELLFRFRADAVPLGLQSRYVLLGSVGHWWEQLAYGVDVVGMSARCFVAGQRQETPHTGRVGLNLGVIEGLAPHELWLELVDGVLELQGPEKSFIPPALGDPQAAGEHLLRLCRQPLGLEL
jgi:hypothetical protein